MVTITIDDTLEAQFRAVAAPDEDFAAFLAAAAKDAIARRARQAAGRAEMEAMLNGPWHTMAESSERLRVKYGLADLSHMTQEELADDAERVITAMDPKVREELEREGLL
jgi:hypothetical protein